MQQLKTEMATNEVKAATITAALKLCSDSRVTASLAENNEMAELNSVLDSLNLQPVLRNDRY